MSRKIYFFTILAVISLSIVFTGCGGGGGKSSHKGAHIVVKQLSGSGGVTGYMPKIVVNSGIVFADGGLEIGENQSYVLCMTGGIPGMDAYLVDDNGTRMSDQVSVTGDYATDSFSQCVDIRNLAHGSQGGTQFDIQQIGPGKCQIVLTAGGYTRTVNVLVWDARQDIYLTLGIAITNAGHTDVNQVDSDIYNQGGEYYLSGDWYFVDTCDFTNWITKFKAITSVDTSKLTTGPHKMDLNGIYVARAKDGGYIKAVRMMWLDAVFDHTLSGTSFRDI